jgi:hypothetical protein
MTKKEKAYLDKYKDIGVEKLAKKLGRSEASVEKYLGINQKIEEPVVEEAKPTGFVHNLFAKKEDRGVVTMTQAASEYLDERRKNKKVANDPSFIHKCR